MFRTLNAAFHQPDTRVYRWVDTAVYTLILASIVLLALETIVPTGPLHDRLVRVDRVLLFVFAIEVSLRIASYHPPALEVFHKAPLGQLRTHLTARLRFAFTPMVLIDIITVLAVVPALRGLRILRLLRLVRTGKLFRYANPFKGIVAAFKSDRVLFVFALTALGLQTVLGGISLYLVERSQNPNIDSIADGIWWAIVTLTTVGFGDITPVTAVGRGIGAALMVGGMFTLALFAGVVGHSLLHSVLSIREEQFRMSDYVNHIVVCGYEEGGIMLLDALRAELDLKQAPVVLFADHERPADLPPEFMWVRGNPVKESELDKVRLSHASTVIVAGERSISPQAADARTILTLFTVRSYMARQKTRDVRRRQLYVVAEVLDSENVAHARTAGADEVIETRRVGAELLAHSVAYPGIADAAGRMITPGDQNLYIGGAPNAEPESFGALQQRLSARDGVLLIGVIDGDGVETVNPGPDTIVEPGNALLYLAELPKLPQAAS